MDHVIHVHIMNSLKDYMDRATRNLFCEAAFHKSIKELTTTGFLKNKIKLFFMCA
jgi:hypothetical protein